MTLQKVSDCGKSCCAVPGSGSPYDVQVYDLLIDTYQAREDIRDNGGHTAPHYLENHIQVLYKLLRKPNIFKV